MNKRIDGGRIVRIMKRKMIIATLMMLTLMFPIFFLSSEQADARATYDTVRAANGKVTGGVITINPSLGTPKLFHQRANNERRTEIQLQGRNTYNVTCNGYYSVIYYDNRNKMIRFNSWLVNNLGPCGQ